MGEMCKVIDYLGDNAIGNNQEKYFCCSNPDNYQTRCVQRQFDQMANLIVQAGAGTCESNDPYCNLPDGE